MSPLEFLCRTLTDKRATLDQKISAASHVLPYCHSKVRSETHDGLTRSEPWVLPDGDDVPLLNYPDRVLAMPERDLRDVFNGRNRQ